MASKSYYNTILSQVFSPCGNFLIVGDIYGVISVFNLQKIINPDTNSTRQDRKPKNSFVVQHNIQINSLLSTDSHLLVGTVSEIAGYTWSHVKSSKDVKPSWKIELAGAKENFEHLDVNCMIHNEKNGLVYVGCSDNKIHAVDTHAGRIMHSFQGHTNYIHSIVNLGNDLISGGEDGAVKMWDLRSKKAVHTIEPHKNDKLARPDLGKWIGAVALNDDWLICGGGPRLSLWHYRSLNVSMVFPIDDRGIQVSHFYQDKILAGGRSSYFYNMNINGDVVAEIPTSSVSIYSAIFQEEPYKALCLSGSSPNIDICSNFTYKDQVLSLGGNYNSLDGYGLL